MTRNRIAWTGVLLWTLTALYFAHSRSVWVDEWNRIRDLRLGLFEALRRILAEPSPFNPGEVVPNWLAMKLAATLGIPLEVWTRLQGIAWGAAALALAFRSRNRYLPWLVAFSVAIFSLSVLMRPYASLVFSGALCFVILEENGIRDRAMNALSWALLAFGHIYGVCFLAFSLVMSGAMREHWRKLVFAAALLAGLFLRVKVSVSHGAGSALVASEVIRQTLGTLTNPHKAALILLPMAAWGFFSRASRSKISLLLAVTVLGPIAACWAAKYFFVPRQIVAGCYPVLALAAEGLSALEGVLPRRAIWDRLLPAALCLAASLIPWTLSTVLARAPFTDQPFHHFREIAQGIAARSDKSVLLLDSCNASPMIEYLERALGSPAHAEPFYLAAGIRLEKVCWSNTTCLSWPNGMCGSEFTSVDFTSGGSAGALLTKDYDRVIVSSLTPFLGTPFLDSPLGPKIERDW